ncbi:MAG: hypothetical protein ACK4UX_11675 [Thiobacillus sp.]|jgi:hypothetical protein
MRTVPLPARCWRFAATTWLLLLLVTMLSPALAQSRLERSGITLYWGLVPAAVVAEKHDLAELHGGPPKGGGQVHHLVVALYDSASGRRIEDAVVRAQISESGIVDEPAKYLVPMKVNELASYGQMFGVAKYGPYRFRLWVRLPGRGDEIEFRFDAWSPHRSER